MIGLVASVVFWAVYAQIEGIREAYYWHVKNTFRVIDIKMPTDEHFLWSIHRFIVLLLALNFASCYLDNSGNMYLIIPAALSFMLIFPFIHDGFMYRQRNILNDRVYPKGFWDQSTTSTAKLTKYFTPVVRTICFVVGVITYSTVIYLAL